jgi:hydroxymethylbilane synthase
VAAPGTQYLAPNTFKNIVPSNQLTIGSRGSKLALFQANWIKSKLEVAHADLRVVVEIIKTSGDIFLDAPLSQIGGKGLFTKEIEDALLARRIDLAVHSLKDLPTVLPAGLSLGAVSSREDVRDAFLSNEHRSLVALPKGARVGTSSLRRQSQLLRLRSDLKVANLRGNLDTRIRKLDEKQYDAILLACAGLDRLGYQHRIVERLSVQQLCPAVGQGALGIEIRETDDETRNRLQCLHHAPTHSAVTAERAFLRRLGGGCQVPIAGHAWIEESRIEMLGVVASTDGQQLFRDQAGASIEQAAELGVQLAERLLASGASEILKVLSAS